ETVLPRVLAGLLRPGGRAALLLVLDGMSAAVAVQLADELRADSWEEYDPLASPEAGPPGAGAIETGTSAARPGGGVARRRGAVAALPTLTRVSRASLFAAALVDGGQDDERVAFGRHGFWGGRPVRLFHRDAVFGGAGQVLSEELTDTLADPE